MTLLKPLNYMFKLYIKSFNKLTTTTMSKSAGLYNQNIAGIRIRHIANNNNTGIRNDLRETSAGSLGASQFCLNFTQTGLPLRSIVRKVDLHKHQKRGRICNSIKDEHYLTSKTLTGKRSSKTYNLIEIALDGSVLLTNLQIFLLHQL